jgi:hypothetical protein
VWALDYQFDQTADGRILKQLHVVDEFTREALAKERRRRIDPDATVAVRNDHVAARGHKPHEPISTAGCKERQCAAAIDLGERPASHSERPSGAARD